MAKINKHNHFYSGVVGVPLERDIFGNYTDKSYKLAPEDDKVINNPILYNDCHELKPKEIEFFVLWNSFKDKHELNEKEDSFDTLEKFIYMFINENLKYIKENGLINELTLFLNYLLDIGEISLTFFYLWTIKINK